MGELLDWLVAHDESFRKARLPSLYSDFQRQKATNPDGYAANITAWHNGLCAAALAGAITSSSARLSLPIDARLLQSLRSSEYGTPSALSSVIDECVARNQLMPYHAFLARTAGLYDRRWTLSALPSPTAAASWLLRQVPIIGTFLGPESVDGRYVMVANVEAVAGKLERYLSKSRERLQRLIPMQTFRDEISSELGYGEGVVDNDLEILLRHLDRDKKAIVYNDQLVKLLPSAAAGADRTITAQDIDLAGIKALHAQLVTQESTLMKRIEGLQDEAKSRLGQSNKAAALRALRRKKTLEAMLEKRTASLSQVEGVLLHIQEASDNIAMVKAMEGGAAVLKSLNKETGGVENVDRIVDSLQEEMEHVEEVSGTMESMGPTVDEGAVDEELEALEEEAKEKEESGSAEKVKSQLDEIPKIPANVGKQTDESTNETDAALEEDIARLERLSVEEPRNPSSSDAAQKEQEAAAAT